MIIKVLIPQAFENMEEATIGKWLRSEGDVVRHNDALCELVTEKTTFDLPAEDVPPGGEVLLCRIVAPEKSVVPVGYCIALLGDKSDELPDVDAENREVIAGRQSAVSSAPDGSSPALNVPSLQAPNPVTSTPAAAPGRVRATPAARRAARDNGIAIEDVAAAFPGKVVTEEDVATFLA